ncbi:MAG: cytidine deaminase [Bernardetiaceae bacterium]|nr:cytidine deaminase [Bernardetiaceae bacterium]
MTHKKQIITELEVFSLRELTDFEQGLLIAAQSATQDAYAPYSNFWVGVAILLENGEVVVGSNQENASYPAGHCAERTAVSCAASLYPNVKINQIAVAACRADTQDFIAISPCGICRQMLLEYENRQQQAISLLMQQAPGQIYKFGSVSSLLPLSFSKSSL